MTVSPITMARRQRTPSRRTESGAALVIALIFLLVMTLTAVVAMRTTTLEQRMAGNARDRDKAFQAAEAALRDAEERLDPPPAIAQFANNNDGWYHFASNEAPAWSDTGTFSGSTSLAYQSNNLDGVAGQPTYLIEEQQRARCPGDSKTVGPVDSLPRIFRITAQGVGGSANTTVVLESLFRPNC